MDATKILYIHGMETGPHGTMYQALNAKFQVKAPNMRVSMFKFQRNSLVRNLIKTTPFIRAIVVVTLSYVVSVAFKSEESKMHYVAVGLGLLYLFYSRKRIASDTVKMSLNTSIEIQRNAIKEFEPDIIIGASWGGFVTLELIRKGYWTGKTILFAPADRKLSNYMHQLPSNCIGECNLIPSLIQMSRKILTVHSNSDRMIDCRDSELLCSINGHCMEFKMVSGDDHTFKQSAKNGKIVEIVQSYLQKQCL